MLNKLKELYLKIKIFKNVHYDFCDDFGDEIFYYLSVGSLHSSYIKKAKEIDGSSYMFSCFRYMVVYDVSKEKYSAGTLEYVTENNGIEEIYSLTNDEIEILSKIIGREK